MESGNMGYGLLRIIYNTVDNARKELTAEMIHDALLDHSMHVELDIIKAMYDSPSWEFYVNKHLKNDEEEKPKKSEKKVKDYNKLLADKMDRIIVLLTGDKRAPFMTTEEFKQKYV